jgi:hypothetical protein
MCKVDHYEDVRSDGRLEKYTNKEFCSKAMPPHTCAHVTDFWHPLEVRPARLSPRMAHDAFPPTPPRSSHSASGSERSSKRRSSVYIDVNGATVIDASPRRSPSRRDKHDHVTFLDSPPLSSRSPRFSSPASFGDDFVFDTEPRHYRTHSRVHSHDDSPSHLRPSVKIEVANGRSRKTYRTHGSKGSRSRDSSEESLLRSRRLADMLSREQEMAQRRVESEIARANELIANRPAVPMAPSTHVPAPPRYRRGSVKVDRPESLVSGLNALHIHDREVLQAEREHRRREKRAAEAKIARKRDEEEAQRQRLKDRMTPRRNTVGGGRHPIIYDHGPYRYD